MHCDSREFGIVLGKEKKGRRKKWQLNDLMTRLLSAPAREENPSRWF